MGLCLQVHVQHHAQALQLVGEELVARFGPPQLLVVDIDLALHGLENRDGVGTGLDLYSAFPGVSSHQLTPTFPCYGHRTAGDTPKNTRGAAAPCAPTPQYPNVVVVAAVPLSLPVEAQAEDGRQRGIPGIQHHGCLELG